MPEAMTCDADRDRNVLRCVVVVDLEVALTRNLDVEPPVFSELLEHVVEEADPCARVHLACRVRKCHRLEFPVEIWSRVSRLLFPLKILTSNFSVA